MELWLILFLSALGAAVLGAGVWLCWPVKYDVVSVKITQNGLGRGPGFLLQILLRRKSGEKRTVRGWSGEIGVFMEGDKVNYYPATGNIKKVAL